MFPYTRTSLLCCCFILVALCAKVNCGMRCEDDYGKNAYGLEDALLRQRIFKELQEIKTTVEDLKSKRDVPETKVQDLPMFDIRYDTLPERCQTQKTPSNCGDATACTRLSGYYNIKLSEYSNDSFLVECDAHTEGGDWIVIQRRHDGSVDFYRTWAEYKTGFGNINGEFFIGLDKLNALTNLNGPQELLILMENATNSFMGRVKYDSFIIGNEAEKFMLKSLGRHSGDIKDSLRYAMGHKFSTKDQDNDTHEKGSCAEMYLGGWWYTACHQSNLNGHYGDTTYGKGLNWLGLTDHNSSLKYVKMMVRRRRN